MQETTLTKIRVPGWALHLFIESYYGDSTIAFPLEMQKEFQHRLKYFGLECLSKYEKPDDPRFLCNITVGAKSCSILVIIGEKVKEEYQKYGLFPYYNYSFARDGKNYLYYFHEFDTLCEKDAYLNGIKDGDPFGAYIILSNPEQIMDEWWQQVPAKTKQIFALNADPETFWLVLTCQEKWALRNYTIIRETKGFNVFSDTLLSMREDTSKIIAAVEMSQKYDVSRKEIHGEKPMIQGIFPKYDNEFQTLSRKNELALSAFNFAESRRADTDPLRCSECGSLNVEEHVWRDPNTKIASDGEGEVCNDCDENEMTYVKLIPESNLMERINDWWSNTSVPTKEKITGTAVSFYFRLDVPEDEYMVLFHEDTNKAWNAMTAEDKIKNWNKYKTSE